MSENPSLCSIDASSSSVSSSTGGGDWEGTDEIFLVVLLVGGFEDSIIGGVGESRVFGSTRERALRLPKTDSSSSAAAAREGPAIALLRVVRAEAARDLVGDLDLRGGLLDV